MYASHARALAHAESTLEPQANAETSRPCWPELIFPADLMREHHVWPPAIESVSQLEIKKSQKIRHEERSARICEQADNMKSRNYIRPTHLRNGTLALSDQACPRRKRARLRSNRSNQSSKGACQAWRCWCQASERARLTRKGWYQSGKRMGQPNMQSY